MNKPPAYQHYAKDWLVGTAHLTLEEQGAYQRLLDHEWEDGPLSADPSDLTQLLGVSATDFTRIWRHLSRHFIEKKGHLINNRLESERSKQRKYRKKQAQKGIASGVARRNRGSTVVQPTHEPEGNSSSSSSFSLKEALKSAEQFKNQIVGLVASMSKNGRGREKTQALMLWVNGKRKEIKEDEIGMGLIVQSLERLKTREANGTEVKSYGRYLDVLYQKVRIEWIQAENERLKHQAIPEQLKGLVAAVGKQI